MNNNLITPYKGSGDPYAYFSEYGLSWDVLKRYKVCAVSAFKKKENSNFIEVKEGPGFAYQINESCYKIYQPLNPKCKFFWSGQKPEEVYVFGYEQLPEKGEVLYVAAGEKDVLSLAQLGHNAICFNSESFIPDISLISELRERFAKIIVVYDVDDTGLKFSSKFSEEYGVYRLLLDKELLDGGKDVSDLLKAGGGDLLEEMKCELLPPNPEGLKYVPELLKGKELIKERKKDVIKFSGPAITINEVPFLFPKTINLLQGKTGVHKSRIAEHTAAIVLRSFYDKEDGLGLKCQKGMKVLYVDTERNQQDQFPYSIQQILKHAKYEAHEDPADLDYISLIKIPREDRFEALEEYITVERKRSNKHIFIILDVASDLVTDFNKVDDSMRLSDFLNKAVNKLDVTFLCVLHENPGEGEKARGHLGTELSNKATTVIQIGYEKGKNKQPTRILAIKCLKNRKAEPFKTVYAFFDSSSKRLEVAPESMLRENGVNQGPKAPLEQVINILSKHLNPEMPSKELTKILRREFSVSDKTVQGRLSHIIEEQLPVRGDLNKAELLNSRKEGTQTIYFLEETE